MECATPLQFMYVMLSLMVGTMYLSSNQTISNAAMTSLLFYVQAFLVFISVAALPALIEGRFVFQRERMNNSLHLLSFTMANFLGALPGIASFPSSRRQLSCTLPASTRLDRFYSTCFSRSLWSSRLCTCWGRWCLITLSGLPSVRVRLACLCCVKAT